MWGRLAAYAGLSILLPCSASFDLTSAIIRKMDFANLGSTGLKVSRICLGTMTYGSKKWREWVLEEEESRPFFKRAFELGINFFDTADMYSDGRQSKRSWAAPSKSSGLRATRS